MDGPAVEDLLFEIVPFGFVLEGELHDTRRVEPTAFAMASTTWSASPVASCSTLTHP